MNVLVNVCVYVCMHMRTCMCVSTCVCVLVAISLPVADTLTHHVMCLIGSTPDSDCGGDQAEPGVGLTSQRWGYIMHTHTRWCLHPDQTLTQASAIVQGGPPPFGGSLTWPEFITHKWVTQRPLAEWDGSSGGLG